MSLRAIHYALKQQNILASWRGDTPATGAELTAEYCAEDYMGLPRLQYGEGETNQLDLVKLAADYDAALVYISNKETAKVARDNDKQTILTDNTVKQLIDASPQQIETWITNNVTDLASARAVLIRLAKAVSLIARENFN